MYTGFLKVLSMSTSQEEVSFPQVEHVVDVSIESAVVPMSGYNVNAHNNQFTVNGTTVTIPPMDYTVSTLLSFLACELANLGIILTCSSHDKKLALKSDSAFSLTFDTNSAHSFMGFLLGTHTATYSSVESRYILESNSGIAIYDTKYIIVKVRDLDDEIMTCTPVRQENLGNRLFVYMGKRAIKKSFQPVSLNRLTFKVEDEMGNTYDTNGLPITLVVQFTTQKCVPSN